MDIKSIGNTVRLLNKNNGVQRARHRRVYEAIRKGVKELGFETVIDPKIESGLVVSVKYPDDPNWDFEKVHDYCYERGFTIYPGKITTTNTFRLCSLGTIDVKDIENFMIVLQEAQNRIKSWDFELTTNYNTVNQ